MSGSKKLYHFCAGFCVDSIKELGLILGICPVDLGDKVKFIPKCQWLTSNPDPQKQSWATSHALNYSRTAYRLTVVIPRNHRKHLIAATEFVKELPKEAQQLVNGWPGSEEWYIYRGTIPPKWIKEIVKMEDEDK